MKIACKRCDIEITFDNGRALNYQTGTYHDIRTCTTKPGFVYCPECRDAFPENYVCEHYKKYGYSPGQKESFFIDLIQKNYTPGDHFRRKQKRKSSQFDKLKSKQICNICKKDITKLSRMDQDKHEEACRMQRTLEAF